MTSETVAAEFGNSPEPAGAQSAGTQPGAPTGSLRAWQRRALTKYLSSSPRDFLAVATPGAGKTTFALRVASELLRDRTVDQITVVAPTEHLKHQWAESAQRSGLALDSRFSNSTGQTSSDYHAVVLPYAQVASHPSKHRVRTEGRKTLVILDEIHHGGDAKSWGDALREAFGDATRRIAVTGTPFRSDDSAIPFVESEPDKEGLLRSKADHSYGYSDALKDGVVRPVVFLAYSGEARWRNNAGEEFTARLGEPLSAEQTTRAWRTALDPAGDWIPAVLQAADTRLAQLRSTGMPDAGGLVIATDQTVAREYAKALTAITGEQPAVVLSDDPTASKRIAEFGASDQKWMVAVRMVSGVSTFPVWRSVCTRPARRLRCTSLRRSGASCARVVRAKLPASFCRRCRCFSTLPHSSRPSVITYSASRIVRRTASKTTCSPMRTSRRTSWARRRRRSRPWAPMPNSTR